MPALTQDLQATRRPVRRGWPALLLAPVAASAVWAVLTQAGVELLVRSGSGTQAVGIAAVVLASLVGVAGAWALASAASRWTAHPRRVFLAVALALLALSLLGPLGLAASTSDGAWLAVLHLVVAAVALPLFVRWLPR